MMQWNDEAEAAIKKVPFFVRKKVRARVETEAEKEGKTLVTLAEVKRTQQHYLTGMSKEVKGWQLDACFGPSGCPNAIPADQGLVASIESLLQQADILGFLKSKGISDLKFHHEFRVTVAECPNACSQPQIKDIGIIAASLPAITDAACTACDACVDACKENAIELADEPAAPRIDLQRCLACGQCMPVCPTGTLVTGIVGFRVQLGGKLGRHPQLARELPGLYDQDAVLDIIRACLDLYKSKSQRGERFGEILRMTDFDALTDRFAPHDLIKS
ncbi:MAG: 4Fe-4S dicluster domain-containing protein [Desulfobacteraceae bacterium]|jgi:dissimilatory sulfite reductase (desulfoviridin) alpha/beta subunit